MISELQTSDEQFGPDLKIRVILPERAGPQIWISERAGPSPGLKIKPGSNSGFEGYITQMMFSDVLSNVHSQNVHKNSRSVKFLHRGLLIKNDMSQ